MKHLSLVAVAFAAACAADIAPAAAAPASAPFITKAAQAGMAEVELADLALKKSKTPAVTSAAGTNAQLVAFAKQTLPTLEAHLALDRRDIASIGGVVGIHSTTPAAK